jgi:hypothetical protein
LFKTSERTKNSSDSHHNILVNCPSEEIPRTWTVTSKWSKINHPIVQKLHRPNHLAHHQFAMPKRLNLGHFAIPVAFQRAGQLFDD